MVVLGVSLHKSLTYVQGDLLSRSLAYFTHMGFKNIVK